MSKAEWTAKVEQLTQCLTEYCVVNGALTLLFCVKGHVRLSVFAALYLCISLGTLLALGCCDAPCLPCCGLDYHSTSGPRVILKIVLLCFCSVSGVTKDCSFASCLVPFGALCNTVCFEIISFLIKKKKKTLLVIAWVYAAFQVINVGQHKLSPCFVSGF